MQIEPVDPHDSAVFDAWHDVYLAADTAGREDVAVPWQREEFRAAWTTPRPHKRGVLMQGRDGEKVVAVGALEASLVDRPDDADVELWVHPDHRRRGHGTALLTALEDEARSWGRTRLSTEAPFPADGPADGAGSPGAEFLRRHGYRLGLGDLMRVLDLPVDADLLSGLAAEAQTHHADYRLESWAGPVPEEWAASWLELDSSLESEAPTGDMVREPMSTDVEVLRTMEQVQAAQGRTLHHSIALDAAGTVVAYNLILTAEHDPGRAFQWGTLVRREHRGHRLGMAVKVAGLRALAERVPDPLRLITYNADENAHMIAINDALGFRPVERLGEFQKTLP